MPLTAGNLPSQAPQYAVPFDRSTCFADAQTLTLTGDLNNVNAQLDIGGVTNVAGGGVGSGAGRSDGVWVLNIPAMDLASGDESYRFHLLGSNDSAFGPGNVDLLGFHDFAAASAGRIIPTLMGPSLAAGGAASRVYVPFVNLRQGLVYRYLRCRVVIGGTTPSITVTSWLSFARELM
jgi:hypothetical protein